MSTELKFGKILDKSDKTFRRDAVHVAVIPVVADTDLLPGQHVGVKVVPGEGLCSEGPDRVFAVAPMAGASCVGIIDPFLKVRVQRGERVYLFLYPGTVTGLTHHWTHPVFGGYFNEG